MMTSHRVVFGCAILLGACALRKCPDLAGSSCIGTTPLDRAPHSMVAEARLVAAPNTLTPEEQADGWRLLFDGKTFNGWRGLGYDTVPTAHWKIENGAIRKIADGQVPRLPDGHDLKLCAVLEVAPHDGGADESRQAAQGGERLAAQMTDVVIRQTRLDDSLPLARHHVDERNPAPSDRIAAIIHQTIPGRSITHARTGL